MTHLNKLVKITKDLQFPFIDVGRKGQFGLVVGYGTITEVEELVNLYNAQIPLPLKSYLIEHMNTFPDGYWVLNLDYKILLFMPTTAFDGCLEIL